MITAAPYRPTGFTPDVLSPFTARVLTNHLNPAVSKISTSRSQSYFVPGRKRQKENSPPILNVEVVSFILFSGSKELL